MIGFDKAAKEFLEDEDLGHLVISPENISDIDRRVFKALGGVEENGLWVFSRWQIYVFINQPNVLNIYNLIAESHINTNPNQTVGLSESGNEAIQLFNPFHDKLGRFTGGRGKGGAKPSVNYDAKRPSKKKSKAGESKSIADLQDSAYKNSGIQAKQRKALSLNKVIGFGALGVAGLAVIAAMGSVEEPATLEDQMDSVDLMEDMDDEQKDRIKQLLLNRPTFESTEEAVQASTELLKSMGIEVKDGIEIEISNKNAAQLGLGGAYNLNENKMVIAKDFARRIEDGDPVSMHVLLHELAHSSQVIDDDEKGALIEGLESDEFGKQYIKPGTNEIDYGDFISYIEAQNETVTMIAMSQMYGALYANDIMWRAHEALYGETEFKQDQHMGYHQESMEYATLASLSDDPAQFIKDGHKNGMNMQYQLDLMPEEFLGTKSSYDPEQDVFISVSDKNDPVRTDSKYPIQSSISYYANQILGIPLEELTDPQSTYVDLVEDMLESGEFGEWSQPGVNNLDQIIEEAIREQGNQP